MLVAELQRRVRQAGSDLVALSPLPERGDLSTRFLRIAHLDSAARHQRLALAILSCIENPRLVESLARALRGGSPQARAEALEVLSHLGDRAAASLLVVLLDEGSLAEKRRALGRAIRPPSSLEEVVDAGLASADPWIRTAAEQHRKEAGGLTFRRETMERLILLREVPLFARLSLEQLEAINGLLTESFYLEGEVVFREGDPAGELYLLVEGEAQIVTAHGTSDAVVLNTMHPPSYIGEMAILDDRPRSATVVISADAHLLSLSGESFKDLMLQMPEIPLEICRSLTGRVRELDRVVAELRGAASRT